MRRRSFIFVKENKLINFSLKLQRILSQRKISNNLTAGGAMKKSTILLIAIISFYSANVFQAQIKLPSIFCDNMVLQQSTNVTIWGKTIPNKNVNVKASWGVIAKTAAGNDSLWSVKIKTPKAGGPYEIQIQSEEDNIVFKNVMIGEVWICSGQSNMEMPLEGWPPDAPVEGSEEAIKNSTNSNIRFFTVTRTISDKPEFDCKGTWVESNPQSAAQFSATAYFFGKKLYDDLKIPVGLIHSSWGGTPIEAWISGKKISSVEQYKSILENIQKGKEELHELNSWLNAKPTIDISKQDNESRWQNLFFNDSTCSAILFDDSRWKEMKLPGGWENTEVGNFDGAVWFRKQIEIPDTWLNEELVLELGPIDDMDQTYINGEKIGGYEAEGFWNMNRVYPIPAKLVKTKNINISVRVIDNQGGGGLWGKPEQLNIHPQNSSEKISLAGNWKYLPVAEYANEKFYLFGSSNEEYYNHPKLSFEFSAYSPTTLYNGMIAPLIPYAVKGAIWYQGEANTGHPEQYKTLLPLMISNWREDWQNNSFPFYFVQIAPFDYGESVQSQKLRESQFLSLNTPHTGMVTTLDIGDEKNIHPAKKREVGERLALLAEANDYGKKVESSGPIYFSSKKSAGEIIVTFKHADGMFIKLSNGINNFKVAGADSVFRDAKVKIKGNNILVSSPEIKNPVAVRYCWDNTSEATLFNKAGLPASSFRTDNWK